MANPSFHRLAESSELLPSLKSVKFVRGDKPNPSFHRITSADFSNRPPFHKRKFDREAEVPSIAPRVHDIQPKIDEVTHVTGDQAQALMCGGRRQ